MIVYVWNNVPLQVNSSGLVYSKKKQKNNQLGKKKENIKNNLGKQIIQFSICLEWKKT